MQTKKLDSGDHRGTQQKGTGAEPSLQGIAQEGIGGKAPARFQSSRSSAPPSVGKHGNVTEVMTDKINMPMWLQVVASISIPVILALLALVALINPQFAELRSLIIENRDDIAENREAIAALDIKLTGEIAALDSKQTGNLLALESKLSSEIAALDSRLTAEITRLDNRLTVEVTRLDSKFDALANLMIVALTNGEPTEAELVAVWESIRAAE